MKSETKVLIRPAELMDGDAVWSVLESVIREGETYTIPSDASREEALSYWFSECNEVFVAEDETQIVGTYFLRANQKGGGSHVSNCGYVTAPTAVGRGVAQAMLEHSISLAKERGFRAMQFNFVVGSNERAVKLWQRNGFQIVGTLPDAFLHPRNGYVDAYVMYRNL